MFADYSSVESMVEGLTLDEIKKRNPKKWELTGDHQMLFELEGQQEKVVLACSKCGNTHLKYDIREKNETLCFPILCLKCGQIQIVFMENPE